MQTLKSNTANRGKQAVQFGVYYPKQSPAFNNLFEVKKILSAIYGETVSYSVLISILLEFFLKHYQELYRKV